MAATSYDWIDGQSDRALAGQLARSQGNTIIVTFSLAVTAAFVGAALQYGYTEDLRPALLFFGWAAVVAFTVILGDRLAQPDVAEIIRQTQGLPDEVRLRTLRVSTMAAQSRNARWLERLWALTVAQLLISVNCWVASVIWFIDEAGRRVGS